MSKMFSRRKLPALLIVCLALESTPVWAQLEEVVVTARKREESIMKVPVVTTALGAEQIKQFAITDMKDISEMVPGLTVGDQVLASGVQVTMRGVGTSTLNPAVDQSVTLNVDGMQMTQGFAYRMAMFDMSQIEVLKGPQALFFGKASTAGVISVRTMDPGDEFDFMVRGGYETGAEERMTEMVLSGPVNDTLGARLAAKYSNSNGYFENTAVPGYSPLAAAFGSPSLGGTKPATRQYDEDEYWLLRGTLVWEPNELFNARLKANYAHDDAGASGGNGQLVSCPDGTSGQYFDFIGGPENCKLNRKINVLSMDPAYFPGVQNRGEPYTQATQYFGTLEWNYQVADDVSLTSVTGYYDIRVKAMINGTGTAQFGPTFAAISDLQREDISQELRLTSDYDTPLNYTLGAYYQDSTTKFYTDLPFNQVVAAGQGLDMPTLFTTDHRINGETWSLFGQVLWNFLPDWELGLGARWTDEHREHRVLDLTGITPGETPPKIDIGTPGLDSNTWSPEATLTWTPTDELTVFASAKQAYKSGSFDVAGNPAPGSKTSFDDERVRGGELGIKSRLFNGRVIANVAGYYYRYKDLQVERSDFDAANGRFLTHTDNAASADVYGVDFDVSYVPDFIEGLTLTGAVNWNKAEYAKFPNASCWGGQTVAEGCNRDYVPEANGGLGGYSAQNLRGVPLLRAPEWTVNAGFTYTTALSDSMSLVVGANANYLSKYLMNPLDRYDMYQNSYTLIGANVALQGRDDSWELAVIGSNLTDKLISGNCALSDFANAGFGTTYTGYTTTGPAGVNELSCNVERGRAVMMRLTLRPLAIMGR